MFRQDQGGAGGAYDPTATLKADCPFCERSESVDSMVVGRAWLSAHIQEEHKDELPEVGGTA